MPADFPHGMEVPWGTKGWERLAGGSRESSTGMPAGGRATHGSSGVPVPVSISIPIPFSVPVFVPVSLPLPPLLSPSPSTVPRAMEELCSIWLCGPAAPIQQDPEGVKGEKQRKKTEHRESRAGPGAVCAAGMCPQRLRLDCTAVLPGGGLSAEHTHSHTCCFMSHTRVAPVHKCTQL